MKINFCPTKTIKNVRNSRSCKLTANKRQINEAFLWSFKIT